MIAESQDTIVFQW